MSISSANKIRVAVIRGGNSKEYEESLKTGEHILSMLRNKPDVYEPVDIFISKEGLWHLMGVQKNPHDAIKYSDVVFNALHGDMGEGGEVQRLLTNLRVPYTGSMALSSALSLNKDMAKNIFLNHGLNTPNHEVLSIDDDLTKLIEIFRNFLHPIVVKPNTEGKRRGVSLVYTFEDLVKAVDESLKLSEKVVVEEFIRGKEARCGVIEGFRGEELYALIPVEVLTPKKQRNIYDYDLKFKDEREYLEPGSFNPNESKILGHVAKQVHQALGLRHYSYSDLIITPSGKVYVLEAASLPDFSRESLLKKSLEHVGSTPEEFLDHVINLARNSAR